MCVFSGKISSEAAILWKLEMVKKSSALKWNFETERISRSSIDRNLLPLMDEEPKYVVKMALLKTATKSQTQRYLLFKGLEATEIELKRSNETDDKVPLVFDSQGTCHSDHKAQLFSLFFEGEKEQ